MATSDDVEEEKVDTRARGERVVSVQAPSSRALSLEGGSEWKCAEETPLRLPDPRPEKPA